MEIDLEQLLVLQCTLRTTGAPLEQSIWRYSQRDVFVVLSQSRDIVGAYFSRTKAEEEFARDNRANRGSYLLLSGSFENLENGDFSGETFDSLERGEIYGCLERYLLENQL